MDCLMVKCMLVGWDIEMGTWKVENNVYCMLPIVIYVMPERIYEPNSWVLCVSFLALYKFINGYVGSTTISPCVQYPNVI